MTKGRSGVKKVLKIIGFLFTLILFIFLGAFFGSFIIGSPLWVKVSSTTVPTFCFGLLIGLANRRLWLLSVLAALGYVLPGLFGGYPTIGPLTLIERLIFLVLLPIVFAFSGGYVGKRLRH